MTPDPIILEGGFGGAIGGTVNACRLKTGGWSTIAAGLTMPLAVTESADALAENYQILLENPNALGP